MLASIALDMDALAPSTVDDPAVLRVHHRRLLEILARHGVVLLDSSVTDSVALIHMMPNNIGKLWEIYQSNLFFEPSNTPVPCISSIQCISDIDKHWGTRTDVCVVETTRAFEFGVKSGSASSMSPQGVEIVRFDLVDESSIIQRLDALSTATTTKGTTRDKLWEDRFKPIIKRAKRVTICDRFAGVQLAEFYNPQSNRGGGSESGLRWFLNRVDQCPKTIVEVITGVKPYSDNANHRLDSIACAFKRLRGEMNGGISTLMLTLIPDRFFSDNAHDRHIRIDESRIFTLGDGTAIFSTKNISQSYECNYVVRKYGENDQINDLDGYNSRKARETALTKNALSGFVRATICGVTQGMTQVTGNQT